MAVKPYTMDAQPGRRTFPAEIDRQAKATPNKVFSSIPRSSDLSKGYQDVTMLDFAKAIDRTCEYLEPLIGYSANFDTVAYYGPPDLRYIIIIIALNKLGFKALLSAPRNSLPMHLHLLNATDCRIILHARQIDVSNMVGTHEAVRHPLPELNELLWANHEPKHYPFTKTFEEAKNDPYLVLHTSGSTGMPKPIVQTHLWAATMDVLMNTPPVNGVPNKLAWVARYSRSAQVFPPWHVAGSVIIGIGPGVWGENVNVWPPADRMASAKDIMDMVEYGNCTEIIAGPTFYEDIVNNPVWYKKLEELDYVWYGGGPLDAKVGHALAQKTNVVNVYGSTEACTPGYQLMTARSDWQYNYFKPTPGIEFRETTPGQYELVFVRHPEDENIHPIWTTFPDIKEYHIKDVFSKHPTKENLWLYEGRLDDLIVFGNGTKHNPLAFEEQLRSNPLIKTALVIGTGHEQAAALIELAEPVPDTEGALDRIRDEIWPTVEAANKVAPKHAVVMKTHVIFAHPAKPFLRASKGTVQRASTLKAYKEEIDELYKRIGDKKPADGSLAKSINEDALKLVEELKASGQVNGEKAVRVQDRSSEEVLRLELKKLQLEKQMIELQIREISLQIDLKRLETGKTVTVH